MEEVFTDMEDVPFAVRFDPTKLSHDAAMLKGTKIRVQPSTEHPWTTHAVEDVEREEDGSVLVRLGKPLAA